VFEEKIIILKKKGIQSMLFARKLVFIILGIFFTGFLINNPNVLALDNAADLSEIQFSPSDRILILAPHPDDEVIGCGGVIQRALKLNIPLQVVFLTYGDNNQWSFLLYRKHPVIMPKSVQLMGQIRRTEAIEADKYLGVSLEKMIFLGYPDFRTLKIWLAHWGDRLPMRSMLTKVSAVPYANAYRPGALYKADEILKDLTNVITAFKPTKIFVSHPADHNPDHQSLYLFTRVALWNLEDEFKPELYPYLVHFKKWPKPYGYLPQIRLIPPGFFNQKIIWQTLTLTAEEIAEKNTAIKKHRSQYKSSAKYLLSFIRANELFGDFPVMKLATSTDIIPLAGQHKDSSEDLPDELLDKERAVFVGVEEEFLKIENNALVFNLKLSRPLGESTGVSMYLFGYKKNTPFSAMPKIHIQFGMVDHKIFDQDKRLVSDLIQVERKAKEIKIIVPLTLMADPERILTSVRTYAGAVPLDWVAWRTLELEKDSKLMPEISEIKH
jgi:LmbE family N-acetylglucosaminyl deacetylase